MRAPVRSIPELPLELPPCSRCKGGGSYLVYAVQGDVLSLEMNMPAARPNPRSLVVMRKWDASNAAQPSHNGWQGIGCAECLGTGRKIRVRDAFAIAVAHTWVFRFRPWFRRFRQFRVFSDTSQ